MAALLLSLETGSLETGTETGTSDTGSEELSEETGTELVSLEEGISSLTVFSRTLDSPIRIIPASRAAASRVNSICFIGTKNLPFSKEKRHQKFPLWYIRTESAARGAVSQRRIRLPREAS